MTLLRKPLLYLLVLSCAASLAASGRFSLRLLFDTTTVFAAVPLIQFLAFAIVYVAGRKPLSFGDAVDRYFAGNGPWYFALAAIGLFGAVASPMVTARWSSQVIAIAGVAAIGASWLIDLRYFRQALGRTPRRAMFDAAAQRAVGWALTLTYFFATTVPKIGSLPDVAINLFKVRP